MKKLAALAVSLFLVVGPVLADTPKDADAPPAKAAQPAKPKAAAKADKSDSAIAAELEELRQAMQAQQEQLQMLKEELAKRDRQIDEAREAAAAANSRAAEASSKATEAAATSAEVKSTAATLNTTVSTMAAGNAAVVNATVPSAGGQQKDEEKGPTTIRFKGVNITPGGFIEAATVSRQRAESADINTQFNGIPYPANAVGKQTETNFSARQSRLTLLVDTKIGDTKVSGYYEADFLGAGTTSNNRESNSYVYRQRQLFG